MDRDSCWERAARLTVLANEMTAELERLREYLAQLPPQTYESLGEQARLILTTAESEAERLRTEAAEAAEHMQQEAADYAQEQGDAADTYSLELRQDTEDAVARALEAAEAEARTTVAEAAQEAEDLRRQAEESLREMRRRTAEVLEEQENDQAGKWAAAEQEMAAQEADMQQRIAALEERGEARIAEAQRYYAKMEETARDIDEEAAARGADLIAQAEAEAARVERATERVLREHEERREELRSHMAHVRSSLATLMGKDPDAVEQEPAEQEQAEQERADAGGTADAQDSGHVYDVAADGAEDVREHTEELQEAPSEEAHAYEEAHASEEPRTYEEVPSGETAPSGGAAAAYEDETPRPRRDTRQARRRPGRGGHARNPAAGHGELSRRSPSRRPGSQPFSAGAPSAPSRRSPWTGKRRGAKSSAARASSPATAAP